jgi:hypothetical protein
MLICITIERETGAEINESALKLMGDPALIVRFGS